MRSINYLSRLTRIDEYLSGRRPAIVDECVFNQLCGRLVPCDREIPALRAQRFCCACQSIHSLPDQSLVSFENGKGLFLISCPDIPGTFTLVRALTFHHSAQIRLHSIAGHVACLHMLPAN